MRRLSQIGFKEMLHAWSMSVVLSQAKLPYKSKYVMVPLHTLLTQSDQRITIDGKKDYQQLNLKYYGGGVVARSKTPVKGKDIKTRRQTLVEKGQFMFSKIDARYGAFGIVPEALDGAVVTAEFPVFTINTEKVIPEFLLVVMTSEEMVSYIKSLAQGSTNRKRLDVPTFMNIQVPLPSIVEQNSLMKGYCNALEKVYKIEQEHVALPDEIQKEIILRTGTEIKRNGNLRGLKVVQFKELGTWSVDGALKSLKVCSSYPMIRLIDCIRTFQKDNEGGSLRVATTNNPSKDYLYVGLENVEKTSGLMTGFELKKGAEIKSGAYLVPKGSFIYGRLRPNLKKYWVNTTQEQNVVCSTEFFVFSLKPDMNAAYFECILSSDILQEQIKKHLTGTGIPRINADDFLQLMIPNPPDDVKIQLGTYFKGKQRLLWEGRDIIASERERAKKEIELQIFEQQ